MNHAVRPIRPTRPALRAALLALAVAIATSSAAATETSVTSATATAATTPPDASAPTPASDPHAPRVLPGHDRLAVEVEHRERPLAISLWYPAVQDGYRGTVGAETAFPGELVLQGPVPDAAPPGGRPLVLIAPGSIGRAADRARLSAALVARGALVAGIDRPGGITRGDTREAVRRQEHAADIAAARDALLDDPTFGPLIDPGEIIVLGGVADRGHERPGPSVPSAGDGSTGSTGRLPGHASLLVDAAHRPRPLAGALWYPARPGDGRRGIIGANAVFVGEPVLEGAAPVAAPADGHPLVLLSHGSGGNVANLGWLASELVRQGVIVAGVDHPGSTSNDSSPRRTIRVHERTADLAALLDAVLADPDLAARIDPDRITVVGFSLGGFTALHGVGARLEHAAFARYCADVAADEIDCRFYARGGVDLEGLDTATFERGARDPRIDRAVAIDPGFVHAMSDASLAGIDVPVELVNLGARGERWSAVELSAAGGDLVGRIPGARYVEEAEANHYTFLGLCTPMAPVFLAEEGEEAICDDPAGTERATTHRRLAGRIAAFATTRAR